MKNNSTTLCTCLFIMTCSCPNASVIFNDDRIVIGPFPNHRPKLVDIDGNGQTDWILQAILPIGFRRGIEIISVPTTNFLFEVDTDTFSLVDFQPLPAGTIIGPSSETANLRFDTPQSGNPRFVVDFPLSPMNYPGEGNFVGETAYLGFRFEGEQGTHYGYALFTDTFSKGTTILATAWESEPDTPIIAGAIPEPSSILLSAIAGFLGIIRRERSTMNFV